jgi:hypothetical protein
VRQHIGEWSNNVCKLGQPSHMFPIIMVSFCLLAHSSKKKAMKRWIVLASLLLIINGLAAYPISPRPLRQLIIESPNIIVGFVERVDTVTETSGKGKNKWTKHFAVARIKVLEVLKGKVSENIVTVSFSPYLICPAPPRYEAGTHVIAFLEGEDGVFNTHALSYGAKTLSLEGVKTYKARICEMQSILGIDDKEKQFMETVSWLVRCAENRYTRWEGTYELSPESDFMSFYDRSEFQPFRLMLNNDDKSRLRAALLSEDTLTYDDMGLVDLVYMGAKDEIYQRLLENLQQCSNNNCWYAEQFMERLLQANHTAELAQIVNEYTDIKYSSKSDSEEKARRLIVLFIENIQKM